MMMKHLLSFIFLGLFLSAHGNTIKGTNTIPVGGFYEVMRFECPASISYIISVYGGTTSGKFSAFFVDDENFSKIQNGDYTNARYRVDASVTKTAYAHVQFDEQVSGIYHIVIINTNLLDSISIDYEASAEPYVPPSHSHFSTSFIIGAIGKRYISHLLNITAILIGLIIAGIALGLGIQYCTRRKTQSNHVELQEQWETKA
jgi:hypothetical protein